MKHYLSDSGVWKIMAEFVDPAGRVMHSEGEAVITVGQTDILIEQWVASESINRSNVYRVTPDSATGMRHESMRADQPHLTGRIDVEGNMLFMKFGVDGEAVNGFEVIHRRESSCYAYGAMYDGGILTQSWTALLNKIS